MARPNFFIIGAPKCGTTSLEAWLAEHPQVFMSAVKEPHYFSEHRAKRNATTEAEYLGLFKDADVARQPVIGEASTSTLHSPGAMERLHAFAPGAKVLIMVRDPVEMVSSMYGHARFRGVEDAPSLAEGWKLSEERSAGRRMPKTLKVGDPVQLTYKSFGMVGRQVERALAIFPRQNVKVIVFDDLKANPGAVYRDVLEFLGLPDDGRTEFPAQNVARQHGRNPLSRVLSSLPHPVTRALKKIGLANRGVVTKVVQSSTAIADKQSVDPELAAEMRATFALDIELLESLIGRDLSSWKG
jgi:hypothetical protein